MESSCEKVCCHCQTPYYRLPSEEQDVDALYEKVWCPQCDSYPFLIKCGYCSSFVHCSSKRDAAPGTIIVCPNQTCSKHFQYISCPDSACRKPNYHPIDMMMGSVTQCTYCNAPFQSVTCNLCWTENYFRGDYRSGVETICRGCKGSFIQHRSSLCKSPAYMEATIYGKCKEVTKDDKKSKESWAKLISLNHAKHQSITLYVDSYSIGRLKENAIQIEDIRLSGKHCTISFDRANEKYYLEDSSSNGTYVNDKKVGKGNKVEIKNGDMVHLLHNSKVAVEEIMGYVFSILQDQNLDALKIYR